MTGVDYPEPVSQLLMLGECRRGADWPDYRALGLGPEQVPDLIRMVQDEALHYGDPQSPKVWAPVHAWRTLGQLRAEAAIKPLIGLVEQMDEQYEEWISDEVPEVLGLIGPAAVPSLGDVLVTPHGDMWAQVTAAHALGEIGKRHPEARDECVRWLIQGLDRHMVQHAGLNGFIIVDLVDLGAVEAAPHMERAFAAGRVDIAIMGDWEDVQIELGLLDERQTPAPNYHVWPEPWPPEPEPPAQPAPEPQWKEEQKAEQRRRDKRKAKRKRQKQARRKQRKRK